MKRSIKINWNCGACGKVTVVTAYPSDPGKMSGPPERCYPPEPAYIDPCVCNHCDAPIQEDVVLDQASDKALDDLASREDERESRATDERIR